MAAYRHIKNCAVLCILAINTHVSAQQIERPDEVNPTPVREEAAQLRSNSVQAVQGGINSNPFSLNGLIPEDGEDPVAELGFRPSEARPKEMPDIILRGIGRMSDKDAPTALLDVDGHGLFIVNVNDTISLQGIPGDNVVRIVEISDISVTIEAGSFGELIVVR